MKDIIYYASTQKDIEAFPSKVKQRIARLLDMLAEGLELQPNDFKYMPTVGMGTYELRIKQIDNIVCSMWPNLKKRFMYYMRL